MRRSGNEEEADLFERMASEEQKHENAIAEWAELEKVAPGADVGPVSWEDPQVGREYDNEAKDPYSCTPYKALAFAVHNEERAFRFYSYVAASARDENVRQFAENLAKEELAHAALLRTQRRRAYHKERHHRPPIDPRKVESLIGLLATAARIESGLANHLAGIERDGPDLEEATERSRKTAARCDHAVELTDGSSTPTVETVDNFAAIKDRFQNFDTDRNDAVQQILSNSEWAFSFYDAAVESACSEAVMLEAQRLSESALKRIAAIRRALDSE